MPLARYPVARTNAVVAYPTGVSPVTYPVTVATAPVAYSTTPIATTTVPATVTQVPVKPLTLRQRVRKATNTMLHGY